MEGGGHLSSLASAPPWAPAPHRGIPTTAPKPRSRQPAGRSRQVACEERSAKGADKLGVRRHGYQARCPDALVGWRGAPVARNSPGQPDCAGAAGLSGYDAPLGGWQPCRVGRRWSADESPPGCGGGVPGRLSARARAPSAVSRLSGERARPQPGPCGRSGGSSWPRGLCWLRPAGGAAVSLRAWLSALRLGPRREPGGRGPSRQAPAAACLCCFLSLARPPAAGSPPGSHEGWEGRLLGGGAGEVRWREVERELHKHTHLQGPPGSSPGMHGPPQVAKSSGENAPAPPPPAPAPSHGCGGRGSRRTSGSCGGGGSEAASGASASRKEVSQSE